jgi:hypothetical protein
MLVIHWAPHNRTGQILKSGIRPAARRLGGSWQEEGLHKNSKGVYCFPYGRNKTLNGTWRRQLKTWDKSLGNYNGFVFRLVDSDFPVLAGHWFDIRWRPDWNVINDSVKLAEQFGYLWSEAISPTRYQHPANADCSGDFEVIVLRRITPDRILQVHRDRAPAGLIKT